jgi:hypothetical protein
VQLYGARAGGRNAVNYPELQILNREFNPNGTRVLQNLTNQENALLSTDLSRATRYLSPSEVDAAMNPYVARMQYGNALERMVGEQIGNDSLLKSMFRHNTTGKGPDFFGRGYLEGQIYDISPGCGREEQEAGRLLRKPAMRFI